MYTFQFTVSHHGPNRLPYFNIIAVRILVRECRTYRNYRAGKLCLFVRNNSLNRVHRKNGCGAIM